MKFTTSTPKGTEGINISYGDEKKCAEELGKILPKDWKIHFEWFQIFLSDVAYNIKKDKKIINIGYNQNLRYWWKKVLPEIEQKLKGLKVIE